MPSEKPPSLHSAGVEQTRRSKDIQYHQTPSVFPTPVWRILPLHQSRKIRAPQVASVHRFFCQSCLFEAGLSRVVGDFA